VAQVSTALRAETPTAKVYVSVMGDAKQQSLAMYQELAGPRHTDTANALVSLAVCEYAMKTYPSAIAHLQQAVEIFTAAEGENSADAIDAIHWLSRVLPSTGDYAQAVRLARRVLEFYDANGGANDQRTAELLRKLTGAPPNNVKSTAPPSRMATLPIRPHCIASGEE
jgi:tetratricopeptide (TPR) repeat protein